MGGLRKFMPITAATFIIGWLAIAGVPPFAGFWSKDEILLGAWDNELRRCGSSVWLTAAAHRVLHDPPGLHGVLRRGALARRRGAARERRRPR